MTLREDNDKTKLKSYCNLKLVKESKWLENINNEKWSPLIKTCLGYNHIASDPQGNDNDQHKALQKKIESSQS